MRGVDLIDLVHSFIYYMALMGVLWTTGTMGDGCWRKSCLYHVYMIAVRYQSWTTICFATTLLISSIVARREWQDRRMGEEG